MLTVELLIIPHKRKQLKCSLTDEWIDKMWYIHTMECYLSIKWNEVLIHAKT